VLHVKNADAKLSGEKLVRSFAGSQGSFKLYCLAAFPHFVIHILALLQLAQVQNSVARWHLCHSSDDSWACAGTCNKAEQLKGDVETSEQTT